MTRIRSVPVAQVRALLTSAYEACQVADGATTPAQYAAAVVSDLRPSVKPPKVPEIKQVWVREWFWERGFEFRMFTVEKQTPTKLHLLGREWHNKTFRMDQEGRGWFRSLEAAVSERHAYHVKDAEYHRVHLEENLCEAFLYEQALAEMVE